MVNRTYNHFKQQLCSGSINLYQDTIKVLLASGSYVFSQNHKTISDITSEISSSNYSSGGKVISNTSVYLDTISNDVFLSGSNVSFSGITANVGYGIVYVSGGSPSTSYLICQVDLGQTNVSNATYNINWNTSGILGLL